MSDKNVYEYEYVKQSEDVKPAEESNPEPIATSPSAQYTAYRASDLPSEEELILLFSARRNG